MPDPLLEEIGQLADELLPFEDEHVLDSAFQIIRDYKAKVQMAAALDGVDRMLQHDIVAIEQRWQARLLKARTELRDGLKALLAWARESKRV